MAKSGIAIILSMALWAAACPALAADLSPPNLDVLAWPRMSVSAFGCYLEKTFGYRDQRFNCSLKAYTNPGDPCKDADAYYEGPAFPQGLVAKVHPLATDIELSWENGSLQAVTITLAGTLNEAEVRKAFKLPRAQAARLSEKEWQAMPANIMDTIVQYPSDPLNSSLATRPSDPAHGKTVITLEGYEHEGAGDVDCGDGD